MLPTMEFQPRIVPLLDLPAGVEALRAEAAADGFRFLDRLVADWRSGANAFDRPGEVLLGAFRADDLIALGGLNRDPYASEDGIGRLRHVYVGRSVRRAGVGSTLVRRLLDHARGTFRLVRLRADAEAAASFYVSLGFTPVQDVAGTHVWRVRWPGSDTASDA